MELTPIQYTLSDEIHPLVAREGMARHGLLSKVHCLITVPLVSGIMLYRISGDIWPLYAESIVLVRTSKFYISALQPITYMELFSNFVHMIYISFDLNEREYVPSLMLAATDMPLTIHRLVQALNFHLSYNLIGTSLHLSAMSWFSDVSSDRTVVVIALHE